MYLGSPGTYLPWLHRRPLIERIALKDRSLADQARRAAQSMMLNVREANRRAGRDRAHGFRIAADIAAPVALADRVLAMLYRLANPRR